MEMKQRRRRKINVVENPADMNGMSGMNMMNMHEIHPMWMYNPNTAGYLPHLSAPTNSTRPM
eukprot:8014080-Ditylum_brightwellii.AAC.1